MRPFVQPRGSVARDIAAAYDLLRLREQRTVTSTLPRGSVGRAWSAAAITKNERSELFYSWTAATDAGVSRSRSRSRTSSAHLASEQPVAPQGSVLFQLVREAVAPTSQSNDSMIECADQCDFEDELGEQGEVVIEPHSHRVESAASVSTASSFVSLHSQGHVDAGQDVSAAESHRTEEEQRVLRKLAVARLRRSLAQEDREYQRTCSSFPCT